MRLIHGPLTAAISLGLIVAPCDTAIAQAPSQSQQPQADASAPPQTPTAGSSVPVQQPADPNAATKTYTVPPGTKVLLQLRSAINTKSAKQGDSVYLASTFPVVVANRVMIPAGVYVQGTIDRVTRAGHVKGRSQLDMHFTSIIFPNGTVVEIPGIVNSLPGAKQQTVKDDGEGTI